MDPSSSDLEFFDFQNSSDDEIKEIQAILKGPGSNGCVELPWEISVRSNFTRSFPETEDAVLETGPATKSAKDNTASQPLNFVPPQTPLPPVAQLPPPPTVETFVTLPTTVGPYQNAPYFVSRTIPYLRAYPPMGVPFFACPMPGAGEANPYGQFVPMVPDIAEPNPKSRDRQSSRRSGKKRLSGETDHSEGLNSSYPDGSQTSVPLVPLPVPPSTFVGGNLPMHGYPPGLHTLQASSPTMYYVPVFNHPYGGYISPSGPSMMLPVNVATDVAELECRDHKESAQTDMESLREGGGGLSENHPEDNCVVERVNRQANYGDVEEGLLRNGCPEDPPQDDGSGEMLRANDVCPKESPLNDNGGSGDLLQAAHSPVSLAEGAAPYVQSDCSLRREDTQPTAKINVTQMEERSDSTDPSSGLSVGICLEGKVSPDVCLGETASAKTTEATESNICLKETVSADISLEATASARTPSSNDCRPAPERVKHVARDPSRCWADLFKGPREVNGFEAPPDKQRYDKKSAFSSGGRRDNIVNGKMNAVPASNDFH